MKSPSRVPLNPRHLRGAPWHAVPNGTNADWADAETRGFMARPALVTPFSEFLRVVLITAMVVAVVKIAFILVFVVR